MLKKIKDGVKICPECKHRLYKLALTERMRCEECFAEYEDVKEHDAVGFSEAPEEYKKNYEKSKETGLVCEACLGAGQEEDYFCEKCKGKGHL